MDTEEKARIIIGYIQQFPVIDYNQAKNQFVVNPLKQILKQQGFGLTDCQNYQRKHPSFKGQLKLIVLYHQGLVLSADRAIDIIHICFSIPSMACLNKRQLTNLLLKQLDRYGDLNRFTCKPMISMANQLAKMHTRYCQRKPSLLERTKKLYHLR